MVGQQPPQEVFLLRPVQLCQTYNGHASLIIKLALV